MFIEEAITMMKKKTKGIKINGKQIHSIRFADDIAILADSEKDMNNMLHILEKVLSKYKLKINKAKTMVMKICKKSQGRTVQVGIRNDRVKEVQEFCYLGSIVTNDNRCINEVKKRIAIAKLGFQNKKILIMNKNLSLETRKKFIKAYVWSVMTYGSETWTLGWQEKRRLEAAKMWLWKRVNRTSWMDRKSNEEVLKEINEKRTILRVVGMRKVKLIGHLMRHNGFVTNIMEGRVLGKESRGRPRLSYIKNLMKEPSCNSYAEMKRLEQDRHLWLQRQGLAFRE
jgi:hypothetical protein